MKKRAVRRAKMVMTVEESKGAVVVLGGGCVTVVAGEMLFESKADVWSSFRGVSGGVVVVILISR